MQSLYPGRRARAMALSYPPALERERERARERAREREREQERERERESERERARESTKVTPHVGVTRL